MSCCKFTEKNCRLCQECLGTIKLSEDRELRVKIQNIFSIKINDKLESFLPGSICKICYDTLHIIWTFIEKIKQTNKVLIDIGLDRYNNSSDNGKHREKLHNLHQVLQESKTSRDSALKQKSNCLNQNIKQSLEQCLNLNIQVKSDMKCNVKEKHDAEILEEETLESGNKVEDSLSEHEHEHGEKIKSCKPSIIYVCPDCAKLFLEEAQLKKHQTFHRKYLCTTCGKRFSRRSTLNCHEKIHDKQKQYKCDECDIEFSARSNLKVHLKKYHDCVRYYCSQCSKEFTSKENLSRHEKWHSGSKDFTCFECPAAFYTKRELSKHERYHTGVKNYQCKLCFKTYYESHHLITHMRTHTGERPFKCNMPNCDKSFMESQKLKRHCLNIHQQLPT